MEIEYFLCNEPDIVPMSQADSYRTFKRLRTHHYAATSNLGFSASSSIFVFAA